VGGLSRELSQPKYNQALIKEKRVKGCVDENRQKSSAIYMQQKYNGLKPWCNQD